jgi:hypothetical protein
MAEEDSVPSETVLPLCLGLIKFCLLAEFEHFDESAKIICFALFVWQIAAICVAARDHIGIHAAEYPSPLFNDA